MRNCAAERPAGEAGECREHLCCEKASPATSCADATLRRNSIVACQPRKHGGGVCWRGATFGGVLGNDAAGAIHNVQNESGYAGVLGNSASGGGDWVARSIEASINEGKANFCEDRVCEQMEKRLLRVA